MTSCDTLDTGRCEGVDSPDAKQFNCAFCDTSMKFGTHLV